jgi:peptidoglycan/LPS O-acetylase OafA/YrhL
MRGIAALYVAVYHFGLYYIFRGGARNVLGHGYIAVDLFFMMSGFVMALTYRDLFAGGQSLRNMMGFLGKRIARIYPLYIIASIAALAAVIWAGLSASADQMTLTKFVSNLLMVQSWGFSDSYVGPGWSISAEWAAYLVFPLLCSIMLFGHRQVALAWAAVAFLFLVLLAELPADITHVVRARGPLDLYDGRNYGAVARCLIEFLLGMLCFRVSRHRGLADRLGRDWVGVCVLALIGVLLAVRNSDILIIPLIALLLVSVAEDKGPVAQLLGSPVFRWLGTISYSIYLIHTTVEAIVQPGIHRAVEASGVPRRAGGRDSVPGRCGAGDCEPELQPDREAGAQPAAAGVRRAGGGAPPRHHPHPTLALDGGGLGAGDAGRIIHGSHGTVRSRALYGEMTTADTQPKPASFPAFCSNASRDRGACPRAGLWRDQWLRNDGTTISHSN